MNIITYTNIYVSGTPPQRSCIPLLVAGTYFMFYQTKYFAESLVWHKHKQKFGDTFLRKNDRQGNQRNGIKYSPLGTYLSKQ